MEYVYKCQVNRCKKIAKHVCENDNWHRFCENCMGMHQKKHPGKKILIQEITNQYAELLPNFFNKLDNFKSDVIKCSIKLIKYIKDCTSNALKELHNHRVVIINQINDLSDINDIKQYTSYINFHVSDQKYFDDINKEIKRLFEIQHVFIK